MCVFFMYVSKSVTFPTPHIGHSRHGLDASRFPLDHLAEFTSHLAEFTIHLVEFICHLAASSTI
jgi:hypothetical protein